MNRVNLLERKAREFPRTQYVRIHFHYSSFQYEGLILLLNGQQMVLNTGSSVL